MRILNILFLSIVMLLCFNAQIQGGERISAFSINKNNYFTVNNKEAKGQISIKYNLIWPFHSGLYVGYTDTFWWSIYDKSAPFREHNYEPEAFYELNGEENIFKTKIPWLNYTRFGIAHLSNGRDEENSRSIDAYLYADTQLSFGEKYIFGINYKISYIINVANQNKDIKDYHGYQVGCFTGIGDGSNRIDMERIYYSYSFGRKPSLGRHFIGTEIRLISKRVQPFFFVVLEHGYGVGGLIDYNKKDTMIRIGIKLK